MRVLVCGGRDFGDITDQTRHDYIHKVAEFEFGLAFLDRTLDEVEAIISGRAKGGDAIGEEWINTRRDGIGLECYPADWKTHGKKAGFIRNTQMLKEGKPDLVIAFPGGTGTKMMVDIARKAGVKVIEVEYEQ